MSDTTKQLECRVVLTHRGNVFDLGMYDPVSGRHVSLGTHLSDNKDKVIRGLRERIEREGHVVTFSEITGPR